MTFKQIDQSFNFGEIQEWLSSRIGYNIQNYEDFNDANLLKQIVEQCINLRGKSSHYFFKLTKYDNTDFENKVIIAYDIMTDFAVTRNINVQEITLVE